MLSRWITLKKIHWTDPAGKERVWESAERTTRGSSGIDGDPLVAVHKLRHTADCLCAAVAVLAILRSETNKFPTSTVIVEQYRPPVAKYVVGALTSQSLFIISRLIDVITELPAGKFTYLAWNGIFIEHMSQVSSTRARHPRRRLSASSKKRRASRRRLSSTRHPFSLPIPVCTPLLPHTMYRCH